MPNENALFDLAKSHKNIMFTGLKNGELIGKREALSAAAEICRRVAASYSGTLDSEKIHKAIAALECEAKILDEIRKLLVEETDDVRSITEGIRSNALLPVEQLISNHEMTPDERADDPRHVQAADINRRIA